MISKNLIKSQYNNNNDKNLFDHLETRGGSDVEAVFLVKAVENFCFVFGCSPTQGVLANTTMVSDFIKHIKMKSDSRTGMVRLPDAL